MHLRCDAIAFVVDGGKLLGVVAFLSRYREPVKQKISSRSKSSPSSYQITTLSYPFQHFLIAICIIPASNLLYYW